MAARDPRRQERGPLVAGVELASGGIRAVAGRREDARLHVSGVGYSALDPTALVGGLVVDRAAVAAATETALAQAEGRERATRVVAALDGDDVRTYHTGTTFRRTAEAEAIAEGEQERAVGEARDEAARAARESAAGDPALRGVATAQLRDDVAGFVLDGRSLRSAEGFHGRFVEVRTDLALAPLLQAGAVTAALEAAKRRATATSGAYALGRLLAESGFSEGGVLRLGADVTAIAVLRDGRVVATRVFGLGRDGLLARETTRDADARVWARCVVAEHAGLERRLPARWYVGGVPESLLALPRALGDALVELRGGSADITPLRVTVVTRIVPDAAMHADHLVAAGAAALAAELY